MKLLFLTARFPYPPLKGDQVRGYHQLRLLAQRHSITLLSFARRDLPAEARRTIEGFGVEVITVPMRYPAMATGVLGGAFSAYPLQTLLYQSALMRRTLAGLLIRRSFDLAHVQLARMAPYLEQQANLPRVIDLIDALSLNMERRYRRDRSPMRLAAYIEWRRLRQYERAICGRYDNVVVVSDIDRAAIGEFPNLHVIPIGVDLTSFPLAVEGREPYTIVFSGNMGYFPNINAVRWFTQEVWPLVRATEPRARFMIVGANPHPAVQALAHESGIEVTGLVPSIHTYLSRATLAVVPMQAGSGMQFKVIEAMACGTPVVVTSFALGGIAAIDGQHLLVCDTAQAFAASVLRLLHDSDARAKLAAQGRILVEECYTWERTVASIESLYLSARQSHV